MKIAKYVVPLFLLLTAVGAPRPASAQDAPAAAAFSKADLEQLVAPIALYPDSLLTQIFMASTYPLEIVEAQRWLAKNPGLTGTSLEEGLKSQDWDPSVKGLCGFPDVVKRMADNLDWTQDLGDAFLGQQAELMDTVQILRGKAYSSGNLKTTEQQVVTQQQDKIIVIESKDPEVIYVPTYSPTVVYAGWGYPTYAYPAMYPVYPPGAGALAFTAGVMWGAAVWGDANWGWGHSDVDIDINKQNNFNRNTNINGGNRTNISTGQGGKQKWSHDASHRKGVNYKDGATASKYGGAGSSGRVSQDQARGRSQGASASASQRGTGGAGARPSTGQASPGASQRSSASPSQRSAGTSQRSAGSSSAYSGARSGGASDRSASSRGASSRGSSSYGGSRSGGGGGGARGGGGGGRR